MLEVYKEIVTRPVGEVTEPFYLPAEEWEAVQKEIAESDFCRDRGVLSKESEFRNFLLAGVEVRITETRDAG